MSDHKPPAPNAWRPPRFMVVVAHPDDADFGPAATAARWIDEGSTGWLVCCTSGDAGGDDWRTDPVELAAVREAEQGEASRIVGYAGISVLHPPDGALANDLALREHLVREIRTFRPDAVLCVACGFHSGLGKKIATPGFAYVKAKDGVAPTTRPVEVAFESHGTNIGVAGFVAPGTLTLAGVFLISFVLYYFVNWKYLSTVWPLS
jgi:hypothetical protein